MLGGPTRDRAEFPAIVEQIGEDPARFLDRDVSADDLAPLIRGIDSVERVRAWAAVERAIDRGPRREILEALDRRGDVLDEIGERADRAIPREVADVPALVAEYPDRPDVDEPSDRAVFRKERAYGPLRERYPEAFDDDQADATDAESAAVATDGGEKR